MCKDCGCGEDNGVVTKVFTVPGMMCNNCKETVEGATLGLEGVLSSEVDLPNKTATVSFDPAKVSVETITTAMVYSVRLNVSLNNRIHRAVLKHRFDTALFVL